jgi:tRNA G18 (ribose-2'-O)-methylase SpoU
VADLVEVSDPADPRLADYRDLRDVQLRKNLEAEHGLFLAEGEKVVRRAILAGYPARSFLMAPRWLDGLADVLEASEAPCYVVSEELAEQVTGFHVHRGALASLHRRPLPGVEEVLAGARRGNHAGSSGLPESPPTRPRVAVLENLVDHANVGSAFRNAAALGVDAVLVTPACADPLYRRAIKTSMGNVFHVPWTRTQRMTDTLDALRAHGYTTVALTLSEDSITLDELVERDLPALAMVFGTEGAGVDPRTAGQVDVRVRIPMEAGVDSLNVAAATAVAFYATR